MRKAIIATLSVLIVLLFIACNTRVNYNKYLIAIDSLIVQQPDTALSMLEAFPTNSLQTQADSAYYGLLMTEARDKNYIIQTNDSLIQSALTYYNGTNDIEKRARAHYYSGCVYRDSRKKKEAMTQYLIAQPLAEEAGEKRLLSLIYLNIGYLYYSQNLNTQADSSYQLAQQIGIQLKDSVLQAEVLSRRGLICMEKGEEFYPEAERMILEALGIAEKLSNMQLRGEIFSALGLLYNWMENGEKSIEFAKRNLSIQKNRTTCYEAYDQLGSAYYQISQYDSARYYLQKALPTKNVAIKAGIYMYLANIAKEQGDLATSLEMERNYSAYLDSIQNSRYPYEIIDAENKQQIIQKKEKYDSSINKHTYIFLVSVGIIIIVTFFSLERYRNRAKQLQKDKNKLATEQVAIQEQYRILKLELQSKEEKITFLQNKIEKYHNNKEQQQKLCGELHKLNIERNCLLKESFNHSDIHNKMRRIILSCKEHDKSEETMEDEDWLQLIAETDRCQSNITLYLQSEYHLTPEEIHLCCLYLTNFPIMHLAYLLNCTRDTIYKKANRILEQKMGLSRKETSLKETLNRLCQR